MNWFRENRFLGTFLVVFAVALVAALWFLFSERGEANEAATRFQNNANELARLQRLNPFPSADNLRKMKVHAEDYGSALNKLREELKARVVPVVPIAPNEFQSRLRVAMGAVAERARTNKVKLPENFFLGFDEFAASLPTADAAPLLAQELAQIELLLNTMIDARVDAITMFRRAPSNQQRGAAATPTPAATARRQSQPSAPNEIERGVVEAAFVSTPAAARRVLNAITTAEKQFYIIRLLHVRSEKDKGPPREVLAENAAATPAPAPGKPAAALNFIVGNEKVETAARIEMLRSGL